MRWLLFLAFALLLGGCQDRNLEFYLNEVEVQDQGFAEKFRSINRQVHEARKGDPEKTRRALEQAAEETAQTLEILKTLTPPLRAERHQQVLLRKYELTGFLFDKAGRLAEFDLFDRSPEVNELSREQGQLTRAIRQLMRAQKLDEDQLRKIQNGEALPTGLPFDFDSSMTLMTRAGVQKFVLPPLCLFDGKLLTAEAWNESGEPTLFFRASTRPRAKSGEVLTGFVRTEDGKFDITGGSWRSDSEFDKFCNINFKIDTSGGTFTGRLHGSVVENEKLRRFYLGLGGLGISQEPGSSLVLRKDEQFYSVAATEAGQWSELLKRALKSKENVDLGAGCRVEHDGTYFVLSFGTQSLKLHREELQALAHTLEQSL